MEPPGSARHRWENRQVEWAGAHESMQAASEFQWPAREAASSAAGRIDLLAPAHVGHPA